MLICSNETCQNVEISIISLFGMEMSMGVNVEQSKFLPTEH